RALLPDKPAVVMAPGHDLQRAERLGPGSPGPGELARELAVLRLEHDLPGLPRIANKHRAGLLVPRAGQCRQSTMHSPATVADAKSPRKLSRHAAGTSIPPLSQRPADSCILRHSSATSRCVANHTSGKLFMYVKSWTS